MSNEQRDEWQEKLERQKDGFAFSLEQLGRYKGGEVVFKLQLTTSEPVRQRKRRWSPDHQAVAKEKCEELLKANLIRRSNSPYAAATVMAKKADLLGNVGALRMCGDYRDLNKVTVRDSYPMPTPDEIFDRLHGATLFTTLDLRQGFNQIELREEDREKTAFHGPDGLYEWTVMPFGLRNASACFQRVMAAVLRDIDYVDCFIDDVVVFSDRVEDHQQHVMNVLQRIRDSGMTCHPKKCQFAYTSIPYLGLQVGGGRLSVQEAKVAVVKDMPAPTDLARLRTFLGFAGYYRRFIKDFATIAKPLTLLMRADETWRWDGPQQDAFEALKQRLQQAPVLMLPHPGRPYVLYTDWSAVGMGAVLSQADADGQEAVVAYASRGCNEHERNYSSYEGEGAAAVWAVLHFRIYLQGRRFTLITDHQPLRWLMESGDLRGKYARWAMILQEHDFEVIHRPGKTQQHADGLSRNPAPTLQWHAEDWRPAEIANSASLALAWLAGRADQASYEQGEERPTEVWEDVEMLQWLQAEDDGAGLQVPGAARGRAQWYRWKEGRLWRQLPEGWRVVPPPAEREKLFWEVHRRLGHYGGRRTLQLLRTGYWWQGIQAEVKRWQAGCETCQRAAQRRQEAEAELQSLPVRELGYRWSLDILGELPLSRRGKRYVLVMIEHVSKWVEAVPMASKSAVGIASHFLHMVLSRYGACAEVVTDQGKEFKGALHQLLNACGIRHRHTGAYHPRANGLTERAVQTVKRGLRKYAEEHDKRDWDLEFPWLLMGYRFSAQESLGVSPYYILHGRQPILPVGCPVFAEQPLPNENSEVWLRLCMAKAKLFREVMPTAMGNLLAAQERDVRRHAQRMGEGCGKSGALRVGDQVWIRRQKQDTLDTGWSTEKWQVLEIRDSGIVRLRAPNGKEYQARKELCYRVRPGGGAEVTIDRPRSDNRQGAHDTTQQHSGRLPAHPTIAPKVIVYTRRNKTGNGR